MLRVAWLGTYVQTQHDDFEDVVGQGMIDLVHDQDLAIAEARLALDLGLTRQFGISVVAPIRFVSSSIRYLAAGDGSEVELVTPGIHHRNETLAGLADPMVLGAFTNTLGPLRVVMRAGASVPLGRTEDNPFTAAAMTTRHQHIQMGTGTVNPVIATDVAYTRGRWRFGGFAFTQQVIYENARGYKAGDRYAAGLALRRQLGDAWSLRGGVEVQGETAERWQGVTHTDDGNRGRFDAMVVAGGSWIASPQLAIDFTLKIPVITHAVGGQLDIPAILEVGAAWTFGGAPAKRPVDDDDHDHGHEGGDDHDHAHGDDHGDDHGPGEQAAAHGPDAHAHAHGSDAHADGPDAHAHGPDAHAHDAHAHDAHGPDAHASDAPDLAAPPNTTRPAPATTQPDRTTPPAPGQPEPAAKPHRPAPERPTVARPAPRRPDVANHGRPGEALDLVPVRGKLTIFDFWATWCVPCKTLDPALVELARRHPDVVAIRKIDVVDWDSAATARYLTPGGFDLPHLKIFDSAGNRVLERSSAPGKLQALIDDVRKLVEAEVRKRPKPRAPKPGQAAAPRRVQIRATAKGFEPATVRVPRGVPVTLVFERVYERTCATEVIFEANGKRIERALPLGKRVEIPVTFAKAGTVRYACGMDMIRGTITVD